MNKTETITFTTTPDVKAKVTKLASDSGVSLSSLIHDEIEALLMLGVTGRGALWVTQWQTAYAR